MSQASTWLWQIVAERGPAASFFLTRPPDNPKMAAPVFSSASSEGLRSPETVFLQPWTSAPCPYPIWRAPDSAVSHANHQRHLTPNCRNSLARVDSERTTTALFPCRIQGDAVHHCPRPSSPPRRPRDSVPDTAARRSCPDACSRPTPAAWPTGGRLIVNAVV